MQTQPHHQSLATDTQPTPRNRSQPHLAPPLATHPPSPPTNSSRQKSAQQATPSTCRRSLDLTALRRKYRQRQGGQGKAQAPQLYSAASGLKVRRAVQADFDFHSAFTRDEVLNYFSVPPGAAVKKRGARND